MVEGKADDLTTELSAAMKALRSSMMQRSANEEVVDRSVRLNEEETGKLAVRCV